ncbi:MAG TPA: A24 family peptidase [Candidatus Acidoferrum sp.]|nr:A24 family peptidase [Candidatus Acidoferrum sp.]
MSTIAVGIAASLLVAAFWAVARSAMLRRGHPLGSVPWLPVVLASAAAAAVSLREPSQVLSALAAVCGSLVAAIVDARTGAIPDPLSLATTLVALGIATAFGEAPRALTGALAGGGALLILHVLTRGRGLGLGDVKLGAAIGAGLGPQLGIAAIATGFVAGAVYAIALLLTHRAGRGDAIRFGPFLALGAFTMLLVPATFVP